MQLRTGYKKCSRGGPGNSQHKLSIPLNGPPQETLSKSMTDGIAPQTGIVPSLSTIQEWHERVVQTDVTAKNELPETPSLASSGDGEPMKKSATPADETPAGVQTSPSTQQRLEFLQYLIKRGIVNEGVEEK